MAKSTAKTTKAKTKNTKKAAPVKAAKSTATKAAKTTKTTKTTAKPAVKATNAKAVATAKAEPKKEIKLATVTRKRREVTVALLSRWHAISAVIFVILAVLTGVYMKSASYDVAVGHLTSDGLLSKTSAVLVPARHILWSVDLRWGVIIMLAVAAIFSLVRFRYVGMEERALATRISPLRWLDYAITGGIAVALVGLLSGMQSGVEVKLLACLTAATMAFAWIAERENANAPRFVKAAYIVSLVSGFMVLMSFAVYAVATPVYGMVRSPWFTYALYGVLLVAGLAVAWLQMKTHRHIKQWTNYLIVERDHLLINLLAKTAFAVILIVGLHR